MIVSSIARGIYLVDTGGFYEDNTVAAYLVEGERYAAYIDVGYGRGVNRLLRALEIARVDRRKLRYIIPTHVHLDHFGATGLLAEAIPGSVVYAHERAFKHIIDPSRLLESAKAVYGEQTLALFGEVKPVESDRVNVLGDEEEIDLGGLTLRAIYAPGHAPHQLTIYIHELGYVASADAFPSRFPQIPIPIPVTPPPSFDLDAALRTMYKIYDLTPRLFLAPHYGAIMPSEKMLDEDVSATEEWVRMVYEMYRDGRSLDEAIAAILGEASTRAGRPLPPTARNVATISVMGLYDYLSKRRSS